MSAQLHRLWVLTMVLALGLVILFVMVLQQSRQLRFAGASRVKMMSAGMLRDGDRFFFERRGPMMNGLQEYRDSAGVFSFLHPMNTVVTVATSTTAGELETRVTLFGAPLETTPVPDMTIRIQPSSVRFETHEGLEVPYFADVVSSFRFTK